MLPVFVHTADPTVEVVNSKSWEDGQVSSLACLACCWTPKTHHSVCHPRPEGQRPAHMPVPFQVRYQIKSTTGCETRLVWLTEVRPWLVG